MDFNLDQLRSFIVVARTGTLSAAAKELGTTQPNLGRQMTLLEKAVNLLLFVRHPRGLGLTKQGQEFLDLCQEVVGQLPQETNLIRQKGLEPEGNLHFLSGFGILENILEDIHSFSGHYPKFSFNFSTNINIYQLQVGDADVVVTPEIVSDSDFIQRPLYDTTMRVYASPQYLQLHSTPKTLEDLQFHRVIVYVGVQQEIMNKQIMNESTKNFLLRPFIRLTSGPLMRTALINSAGIGCYTYNRNIMQEGLLVDVFPDMPDHIISYYFTYHKRLEGSPKVEVFYEFLKEITKIWEWREEKDLPVK